MTLFVVVVYVADSAIRRLFIVYFASLVEFSITQFAGMLHEIQFEYIYAIYGRQLSGPILTEGQKHCINVGFYYFVIDLFHAAEE